jgi:hypothetical protein
LDEEGPETRIKHHLVGEASRAAQRAGSSD